MNIIRVPTESALYDAARRAVSALAEAGLTAATAESCTGGLIAKLLTDVPGSSDVFAGGVVSYSNDVKMSVLGVGADTLAAHGAVSEETAREMAHGASRVCGADIAVSTTGIAGPGGGTPEKPVGTVWTALCAGKYECAELLSLPSALDRENIRKLTAEFVLNKLAEAAGNNKINT